MKSSWEGIKIFDISDVANPRYIKSVETDCGSHTHSLIPGAKTDYLYVSSYSPSDDLPRLQAAARLDLDRRGPEEGADHGASVVATPNLFPDGGYTNTSGCHDITVIPAKQDRGRRLHG